MDINELNSMNVVAQFNKLVSQIGIANSAGESFACMLEKSVSDISFVANNTENKTPVENKNPANDKQEKVAAKDGAPVVDKSSKKNDVNKTEKTSGKEKVKKTESKTVDEKNVADTKDVQEDDTVTPVAAPVTAEVKAPEMVEENVAVENISYEDMEISAEPTNIVQNVTPEENFSLSMQNLLADVLSGKSQLLDENGNILNLQEIKPEAMSEMANLTIVNLQTKEKVQIKGSDLLAQQVAEMQPADSDYLTANDAVSMVNLPETETKPEILPQDDTFVVPQNQDNQNKVFAPNVNAEEIKAETPVENTVKQDVALSSVKPQQKTNVEIEEKTPAFNEEIIVDEDENPLEQVTVNKNLKVDVTVKEEKISFVNNKDLLKDGLSLQETVQNVDAEATQDISQPVSNKATPSNQNINLNTVAATQTMATAEDTASVHNASVTEVKQVSSTSATSQAALSGAELVASAKADAASKSHQTTLNDVYKGMSKEAVEQVKVNITKSAVKGVDTIEVNLKPEDLGHIEIKMQIKDGKLHAHIISSRQETMEALQRDAQVLEKAFNDAGFQTDANSLSFSFRHEGNQAQEQHEQLRNFIGKVFEEEANSDVQKAEAANQNWITEKGVNIRV